MENIAIQNFERLEALANSKSFNQLTPEEKEWILCFQTEKEYNAISNFYEHTTIKRGFNEIEPQKSTKSKLDDTFGLIKKRSKPIYLKKIPFYQSVAAAVVCLIAGFWIHFSVGKTNDSHKIAQELVRDTIQVIQYIQSPSVYFPLTVAQNQLLSQAGLRVMNNEKDLFVDTLYHVTGNVFVTDKKHREAVKQLFQKNIPTNDKNLYADTLLKKMLIVLY